MTKYILGLFLLIAVNIFGQSSFITTSSENEYSMTENEYSQFEALITNSQYVRYMFVDLGNLQNSTSLGELAIQIQGDPCGMISYNVDQVNYIDETHYIWSGSVHNVADNDLCSSGSFFIRKSEADIFGMFSIGKSEYVLQNLGPTQILLLELNTDYQNHEVCGFTNNELTEDQEIILETESDGFSFCTSSILVFYDPTLDYTNGSISANSQNDFENWTDVNMAILATIRDNSSISNVRFELIGVEPLPEGANVLKNNDSRIYMDNFASDLLVQQRKDDLNADIVVLFTEEGAMIGSSGNTIAGRAFTAPALNTNEAYVLVELSTFSNSRLTFAHKIAHIFGAWHNELADPIPSGLTAYSRAHEFGKSNQFKTTLASASGADQRILHFSNPEVLFNNRKTGRKSRNNARRIQELSCFVSRFEDPLEDVPPTNELEAPSFACLCSSVQILFDGDSGFSNFRWFISPNGIDFTLSQSGNSSIYSANLPCEAGKKIFIRLIVENEEGIDETFETNVRSSTMNSEGIPCALRLTGESEGESPILIRVYPNPVTESLKVALPRENSQIINDWSFKILNYSGQTIKEGLGFKVDLSGEFFISVAELPSGLYVLELFSSSRDYKGAIKFNKI